MDAEYDEYDDEGYRNGEKNQYYYGDHISIFRWLLARRNYRQTDTNYAPYTERS